jgi:uncharacterized protein
VSTQQQIDVFPETLAVVRLGVGVEVPRWAESSSVFAVIATATETTLVCAARSVPTKTHHERPFTAFRFEGRAAEVPEGARVISAFDHDWVLVQDGEAAAEEWRRSGHTVAPATPRDQGNKAE